MQFAQLTPYTDDQHPQAPVTRRFEDLEPYQVELQSIDESPRVRKLASPSALTLPVHRLTNTDGTSPQLQKAGREWWGDLVRRKQRTTNSQLNISLNSLLLGALNHSAQIQLLSEDPLISETEITTADAAFDWTTFLDARWDDLSEPVGSTLTTGGPDRLRDHNANVEFGVRRRNTIGGEIEIGQRLGHQNNNSIFFVPNDQGTARLTLSYTQPLLRGAGRAYNTSLTVLAKLKTGVSRNEFERQLQDQLLDITQSYWNLYFERGKLLQQQRLLQYGIEILEELDSRKDLDALQSQIVRARAAVENRRAQLIRSRLSIKIAEARIRALVNDPGLGDTLSTELIPQEELLDAPFPVDLKSAVSQAFQYRPEMSAALTQIKAASVRMSMSKTETLPLLNLILESYVFGLEGDSDVGEAFTDQFFEGEPSYGVGIQYEYPIWNRAASSRLQKRRLELRRLQHQLRSTMETLKLEVEVAVHELNAAFESLPAKRRAMEAAAEEVDYLKDRWQLLPVDNGSASLLLEDLLDAQDRLTEAEQSMLQSSLEYSLSQVTYKRAIGTLLNQNGVAIGRSCECSLPAQNVLQVGTSIGGSAMTAVPTEPPQATQTHGHQTVEAGPVLQQHVVPPAQQTRLGDTAIQPSQKNNQSTVPMTEIPSPFQTRSTNVTTPRFEFKPTLSDVK